MTLKASDAVERITDPVAMLVKATKMEEGSVVDYNNFAIACATAADSKTKQLFESLVA